MNKTTEPTECKCAVVYIMNSTTSQNNKKNVNAVKKKKTKKNE